MKWKISLSSFDSTLTTCFSTLSTFVPIRVCAFLFSSFCHLCNRRISPPSGIRIAKMMLTAVNIIPMVSIPPLPSRAEAGTTEPNSTTTNRTTWLRVRIVQSLSLSSPRQFPTEPESAVPARFPGASGRRRQRHGQSRRPPARPASPEHQDGGGSGTGNPAARRSGPLSRSIRTAAGSGTGNPADRRPGPLSRSIRTAAAAARAIPPAAGPARFPGASGRRRQRHGHPAPPAVPARRASGRRRQRHGQSRRPPSRPASPGVRTTAAAARASRRPPSRPAGRQDDGCDGTTAAAPSGRLHPAGRASSLRVLPGRPGPPGVRATAASARSCSRSRHPSWRCCCSG